MSVNQSPAGVKKGLTVLYGVKCGEAVSGSTAGRLSVGIETQGHVVQGMVRGGEQKGGGRRGRCEEFSPASRARYLQKIERLEYQEGKHFWTMTTLTYPVGSPGALDGERAARDLEVWWKKHQRATLYPTGMVWVKELQPGRQAIHFHLLIYGRYMQHANVCRTWGEVIGYEGKPVCWVEKCKTWRAALKYAAKYMVKAQAATAGVGGSREAGTDAVGEYCAPHGDQGPCSLDTVTYSAVQGRWWGVKGEENLPWGDLNSVVYAMGKWFYQWRRCARRAWRGVNGKRGCGFTLFTGDPVQWLGLAAWFYGQDRACGSTVAQSICCAD